MSDHIIAIARQNGSGGRDVGRLLADRLGVPCYDCRIVSDAARIAGLSEETVMKEEERSCSKGLFFGGISPSNPVYRAQCRAIGDLAANGPCVFVGRNADFVLRNDPGLVSVFIHAPLEDRIRRSMSRNGISVDDAAKRVRDKDSERAEYCRRYTGRLWGESSNYDLSICTSRIGVEGAVDIIMEYISRLDREGVE